LTAAIRPSGSRTIAKVLYLMNNSSIPLTAILNLGNLDNVMFRFNLMVRGNWNPIELFKNGDISLLLEAQYWNYATRKSFREGQLTVGLVRLNHDLWLLFHVGRVTRDLNVFNGIGYEFEVIPDYEKYFGRLVVRFKNRSQTMVRRARSVIDDCEVAQILPSVFDDDIFPGYDQVNVSWQDLRRILTKESWRTALENQKGVYLITDLSNGKKYVGSAYGDQMLLGRWSAYAITGHGGNVELMSLELEYIKENFRFAILDIFKSTTDDRIILSRESWWKTVLDTREHGYNRN
jgi:hypothetical protein